MSALLNFIDSNTSTLEVPVVCAVYSPSGELIATELNSAEQEIDPTGHAEILAIRKSAKLNSHSNLDGYSIYITLEPCLMCFGAILHANIKKVIFGAYSESNSKNYSILDEFRHSNPQLEIVGGVLEKECQNLISNWFKSIR
jgi:tRNA(adenine34) deaminase